LSRSRDDRGYGCLVLPAEALRQEVLEVAELDAAIDRTAGRKNDDERVRASRGTLCALGCVFDRRQALLKRRVSSTFDCSAAAAAGWLMTTGLGARVSGAAVGGAMPTKRAAGA
jgi:hypothetical protein